MTITNDDLTFLILLENSLGAREGWSDVVHRLWQLNEKLLKQRDEQRKKSHEKMAAGRKIDKNYGRSKKENK